MVPSAQRAHTSHPESVHSRFSRFCRVHQSVQHTDHAIRQAVRSNSHQLLSVKHILTQRYAHIQIRPKYYSYVITVKIFSIFLLAKISFNLLRKLAYIIIYVLIVLYWYDLRCLEADLH